MLLRYAVYAVTFYTVNVRYKIAVFSYSQMAFTNFVFIIKANETGMFYVCFLDYLTCLCFSDKYVLQRFYHTYAIQINNLIFYFSCVLFDKDRIIIFIFISRCTHTRVPWYSTMLKFCATCIYRLRLVIMNYLNTFKSLYLLFFNRNIKTD